jgi:hypothetical protein
MCELVEGIVTVPHDGPKWDRRALVSAWRRVPSFSGKVN